MVNIIIVGTLCWGRVVIGFSKFWHPKNGDESYDDGYGDDDKGDGDGDGDGGGNDDDGDDDESLKFSFFRWS